MLRHMPKYRKGVLTPGICTLFLSSVLLSMLSRRRRFHPCVPFPDQVQPVIASQPVYASMAAA